MALPLVIQVIVNSKQAAADLDKAAAKVSGIGGKMKGAFVGLGAALVATKVVDFIGDAVKMADTLNDANDKLKAKLGDSADAVVALEDKFTGLGLSNVDVGTLATRVADLGTAAHLNAGKIAELTGPTVEAAGALALISDADPTDTINAIGKAATTGALKPLQALGVSLSDAEVQARALRDTGKKTADKLTDAELASARWKLILEKLAPVITAAKDTTGDLGDKQDILKAKLDTLTEKIGEHLRGPLSDFLGWTIDMLDAWEGIPAAWERALPRLREMAAPFARLADLISTIVDKMHELLGLFQKVPPGAHDWFGGQFGGPASGTSGGGFGSGAPVTVNVATGADPSAVVRAIRSYARDNGGVRSIFRGIPA